MGLLESIGSGLITNFLSDAIKKKVSKHTFNNEKPTEVNAISKRLTQVLELMNDGREEALTIAQLSQMFQFKKISKLENYFLGQKEPSIEFLKEFSAKFAINSKWLIQGQEEPFKFDQEYYSNCYDCIQKIHELNPTTIYFIRSDSICGETCILLEINEYHFLILNHSLHFSGQVGWGGSCELASFRKLVMKLILEENFLTLGLVIPKRKFSDLYKGKIYPNTILKYKNGKIMHWHDDFTDIYNQRCGYQHHNKYDQNFKDAFRITKSHIEKYEEP